MDGLCPLHDAVPGRRPRGRYSVRLDVDGTLVPAIVCRRHAREILGLRPYQHIPGGRRLTGPAPTKIKRDAEIIDAYTNPPYPSQVLLSQAYGISRERVRQILKRAGHTAVARRRLTRRTTTCPACGDQYVGGPVTHATNAGHPVWRPFRTHQRPNTARDAAMLARVRSGESVRDVAAAFGLRYQTAHAALSRAGYHPRGPLTWTAERDISLVRLAAIGVPRRELGLAFGLSDSIGAVSQRIARIDTATADPAAVVARALAPDRPGLMALGREFGVSTVTVRNLVAEVGRDWAEFQRARETAMRRSKRHNDGRSAT